MSSISIHPRHEVFTGVPTNMNGTPRPLLARGRRWVTVHYVGTGSFLDPGDTPDEARSIERWASSPAKNTPWEYNWIVDGAGEIWEYAGDYVAAHSAGENPDAHGVLLLLGGAEAPTEQMIDGFRQLRAWLTDTGRIAPTHEVRPHRAMPDAGTVCPGTAVMARWADLTDPWAPAAPELPVETDVILLVRYRDTRYTNVFLVGGGPALNLSGELDAHYDRLGVPLVEGTHDLMLAGLMTQAGIDNRQLVPR